MTALRFQTGGRHQTSLASLWGLLTWKKNSLQKQFNRQFYSVKLRQIYKLYKNSGNCTLLKNIDFFEKTEHVVKRKPRTAFSKNLHASLSLTSIKSEQISNKCSKESDWLHGIQKGGFSPLNKKEWVTNSQYAVRIEQSQCQSSPY